MDNNQSNFSRIQTTLHQSFTQNTCENNSTYGTHLNLEIREKEYCLPFLWCVTFSKIENKGSNEHKNICNTRFVCEGVLCYENGQPLSFKNMGFSVINHQKCLPNFCFICGTTKFLKFRVDFERDSVSSNGNRLKEVETAFLQAQITYKLTESQTSVNNFLLKMGLISSKEKSLNRYRNILISQSLLSEMKKILSEHSHSSANNKMEDCEMKEEKKENCENKQESNEKERQCCSTDLPKKQSQFPIINSQNNQIIKINRLDFLECAEINAGGYFNVHNYNALIETFVPDSSIDTEIFPINKHKKYQFEKKIAIKKLKKEVSEESTQKYRSKLQHEISIIQQIGKNENVCQYYDLPETISSISTEDGRSMIENESSSTIIQSFSSMHDEAEEGLSESSTVEEAPKPFQYQSKTIIMENLSFNLQHVLNMNPLCNIFQLIKQLVNSVRNLHESGIVHRDIKPANIMFNDKGKLKLIDFSESVESWRYFEENGNLNLGFTLPYSPFECATTSSDGFAHPKIDNWSIGMVISEILLGELPVCYSKMMAGNFKEGGQPELHWCYNLRVNSFHDSILFPLKILCLSLLKSEANERLCLTSIANFLSLYESLG